MLKSGEKISVQEAISELLYQNDCVIIPKFGGFVKEYQSSRFDYVQGKISPPSSSITFNDNLIADDGLLIDFYKKSNGISLEQAQKVVEQFYNEAKLTLSNKEVVSFPKIGRLLKDYENNTKFITENFNFNTDTFGLPEVMYYPILREMPGSKEKAVSDKVVEEEIPQPIAKVRKSQTIAKVAIPVFVLLMIVSAFAFFNTRNSNEGLADATTSKEDASKLPVINKSPTKEEEAVVFSDDEIDYTENEVLDNDTELPTTDSEEELESEALIPEEGETSVEIETPIETETITYDSEEEFEVIFVGMFSKQHGVDVTAKKIMDNNWIPYTEVTSRGATRVGVKVLPDTDIDSLFGEVKAKINSSSFIRKRK